MQTLPRYTYRELVIHDKNLDPCTSWQVRNRVGTKPSISSVPRLPLNHLSAAVLFALISQVYFKIIGLSSILYRQCYLDKCLILGYFFYRVLFYLAKSAKKKNTGSLADAGNTKTNGYESCRYQEMIVFFLADRCRFWNVFTNTYVLNLTCG